MTFKGDPVDLDIQNYIMETIGGTNREAPRGGLSRDITKVEERLYFFGHVEDQVTGLFHKILYRR